MPRVIKLPKKGLLTITAGTVSTHGGFPPPDQWSSKKHHLRWVESHVSGILQELGWYHKLPFEIKKSNDGRILTLWKRPDNATGRDIFKTQVRPDGRTDFTISHADWLPYNTKHRNLYVYEDRAILAFPKDPCLFATGRPLSIFSKIEIDSGEDDEEVVE